MRTIPKIISVDDHLVEPKDLWTKRLPQKYRDVGPRVVRDSAGTKKVNGVMAYHKGVEGKPTDWWVYEDYTWACPMANAAVGIPRDQHSTMPINYEDMRAGAYSVKDRLKDMDEDHVDKAMCYPSFARFCGQTFLDRKDMQLALLCVQAYNDWMIEEWCGESEGRLIPLCLIPLWDPQLAAAEVRRNAARGCRAVSFTELPVDLGLPSIHSEDGHWKPFLEACEETGTIVCMHIGGGKRWRSSSPDAPLAVPATLTFTSTAVALTDWLFSGHFKNYPKLKICLAEGQVGWMPFVLERADEVWEICRSWAGVKEKVPNAPSSYIKDRVFTCFFNDMHGVESRDKVGVDQICFETDYPHQDSFWPNSLSVVEKFAPMLDDDALYKILRGNAIRMLGLDCE